MGVTNPFILMGNSANGKKSAVSGRKITHELNDLQRENE